jgi:hypothetical protein
LVEWLVEGEVKVWLSRRKFAEDVRTPFSIWSLHRLWFQAARAYLRACVRMPVVQRGPTYRLAALSRLLRIPVKQG